MEEVKEAKVVKFLRIDVQSDSTWNRLEGYDRPILRLSETVNFDKVKYNIVIEEGRMLEPQSVGSTFSDACIYTMPPDMVRASPAAGCLFFFGDGTLLYAFQDEYGALKSGTPTWDSPEKIVDPQAPLLGILSTDGGKTWCPRISFKLSTGEDLLSFGKPSVIRMTSGKLGLTHTSAMGGNHEVAFRRFRFHTSEDEGKTWSSGVDINPPGRREFLMMDCLVQLKSGRIVVPCSVIIGPRADSGQRLKSSRHGRQFSNAWCFNVFYGFCYYSDDEGANWQRSMTETHATIERGLQGGYSIDEVMVVELENGNLLMLGDTSLGRIYRAYSKDQGETWFESEPTKLVHRRGPFVAKKVPDTDDVLVIWNQVSDWEGLNGMCRHRLSTAVGRDGGKNWSGFQNLRSLDDEVKLEPESIDFKLLGQPMPPVDTVRYHRAPGPMRIDHPSCTFHDGKAYIAYGVGALGNSSVIEKTYGLDFKELAQKNGFIPDPAKYGKGDNKDKWWRPVNEIQVVPIENLY